MPDIKNNQVLQAMDSLAKTGQQIWSGIQSERASTRESNKTKRLRFGADLINNAVNSLDDKSTPEEFEASLNVLSQWKDDKFLGDKAKFASSKVDSIQKLGEKRADTIDEYDNLFEMSKLAGGMWSTDAMGEMLYKLRDVNLSDIDWLSQGDKADVRTQINSAKADLRARTILKNLMPEYDEYRQTGKQPTGMDDRLFNSMVEAGAFIDAGDYAAGRAELSGYSELKNRMAREDAALLKAGSGTGTGVGIGGMTNKGLISTINTIGDGIMKVPTGGNVKDYHGSAEAQSATMAAISNMPTGNQTDSSLYDKENQYTTAIVKMLDAAKNINGKGAPNIDDHASTTNWLSGFKVDGGEETELLKGFIGKNARDAEIERISKERIERIDWSGPMFKGGGKPRGVNMHQLLKGRKLVRGLRSELFADSKERLVDPNAIVSPDAPTFSERVDDRIIQPYNENIKPHVEKAIDYYPGVPEAIDRLKETLITTPDINEMLGGYDEDIRGQQKDKTIGFVKWIDDLLKTTPPY